MACTTCSKCTSCGVSACECSCGCAPITNCCNTASVNTCNTVKVSHADTIVQGNVSPVLLAERSFSIPACNETAIISVEGEIASPPTGSQIYIAKDNLKAFLTVISTTRIYTTSTTCSSSCGTTTTQEVERTELTVRNDCLTCTTIPIGTFIDQGSPMLLTPPDCTVTASGDASDLVLCGTLVVPEIGATTEIVVSPNTSSLSIGDIIQITDKKFQVVAVPSSTVVEVKNIGEGGDPGTVIDGCDCATIRIFIIAGDSPCTKDPVAEADAVLVCENGAETILDLDDGEVVGQVNGRIVGVSLPLDSLYCAEFAGCLTLNPALNPQEYLLVSDDASGYNLYDTVVFDCDDQERQFTITGIAVNNLTLTPNFTVTAVETIADDCTGCKLCQVCDVECILPFTPDYKLGSFGRCHEHAADPEQPPIDVAFANGQLVGHFTEVVTIVNGGADPLLSYTNNKNIPVLVSVEFHVVGFHNNISDGVSQLDDETVSRYAWNLIDIDNANAVVAYGGFTLGDYANDIPLAEEFDDTEGNWADAGGSILFKTGNVHLKHTLTLQPGESINYKVKELFSYKRTGATGPLTLRDDMCYDAEWDIRAEFVQGV